MNIQSIILLGFLAIVVVYAIYRTFKKKGGGDCDNCNGGCCGCC